MSRGHWERGVSAVEYALGVAVVVLVLLGAVQALADEGADELNRDAPRIGTPTEDNALNAGGPPSGGGPGPTPGPAPGPATVHAVSVTTTPAQDGSDWSATVVITFHNSASTAQSGVTCAGTWTPTIGSPVTTFTTGANGQCVLTQGGMRRTGPTAVGSVEFDLQSVSGVNITYDPPANTVAVTDIVIPKP